MRTVRYTAISIVEVQSALVNIFCAPLRVIFLAVDDANTAELAAFRLPPFQADFAVLGAGCLDLEASSACVKVLSSFSLRFAPSFTSFSSPSEVSVSVQTPSSSFVSPFQQ